MSGKDGGTSAGGQPESVRNTVGKTAGWWVRTACYWLWIVVHAGAEGFQLWLAISSIVALTAVVVREKRPELLVWAALVSIPVGGMPLAFAALFSFALRRRDRWLVVYAVAALVLVAVTIAAGSAGAGGITVESTGAEGEKRLLTGTAESFATWGLNAAFLAFSVASGAWLGVRRELIQTLQSNMRRAQAEQESRAREAALMERTRIAGEMHDVLGHKLALLTMQAGALEVSAKDESSVEMAEQIRSTARDALADLRSVVGTLHGQTRALAPHGGVADDGFAEGGVRLEAPRAPIPDISDVPSLVAASRAAGASVTFTSGIAGPIAARLDPDVSRAAHRVVQEGLTNAHNHAPGEQITVSITLGDRGLTVVVGNSVGSNPAELGTGNGLGLQSLRERVRLVGGTFRTDVSDSVFRITATFPSKESFT